MNEIISVGLATSIIHQSLNLFIIHLIKVQAVNDVLTDSSREENGLLLDDRNLAVVPLGIKFSDISAIEQDLSLFRIIEAFNQRDDRRLSTATCAAKSNNTIFLIVNREGDTFKYLNIILAWVAEFDILELKIAFNNSLDFITTGGIDSRLVGH